MNKVCVKGQRIYFYRRPEPILTYLCNRDTVNPVYNPLRELVGIYVEVING